MRTVVGRKINFFSIPP